MLMRDATLPAADAPASAASPPPQPSPTEASIRQQLGTLLVHAEACQAIQAQQQGELSLAELKALAFLNAYGQLPTGQLRLLMGLSPGGVTALINRLEAAGHLRRGRLPGDRRVVALLPMAAAQDDFELLRPSRADQHRSPEELEVIHDFLDGCTRQLRQRTQHWLGRRDDGWERGR